MGVVWLAVGAFLWTFVVFVAGYGVGLWAGTPDRKHSFEQGWEAHRNALGDDK